MLYVSGYAHDVIAQHGVPDAGVALIAKPFTLDALSRRVREILDNKPPERRAAAP